MPGRTSRIRLRVDSSHVDGLLLLAGKLDQVVGEGVGDAEVHNAVRSESVPHQRAANRLARTSGHLSNAQPQPSGTSPR